MNAPELRPRAAFARRCCASRPSAVTLLTRLLLVNAQCPPTPSCAAMLAPFRRCSAAVDMSTVVRVMLLPDADVLAVLVHVRRPLRTRARLSRAARSRFLRARMKCAPLTAVTVDSLSSLYSVLFDLFVLTLAPRARAAGAGACRQGAEGARRSLTRVRAADELGAHARRRRVARTLAEQGAASASLEPRRHRQRHPPGAEPRDCARHERRAGSERRSGRVAEARTVVDAHIR